MILVIVVLSWTYNEESNDTEQTSVLSPRLANSKAFARNRLSNGKRLRTIPENDEYRQSWTDYLHNTALHTVGNWSSP